MCLQEVDWNCPSVTALGESNRQDVVEDTAGLSPVLWTGVLNQDIAQTLEVGCSLKEAVPMSREQPPGGEAQMSCQP